MTFCYRFSGMETGHRQRPTLQTLTEMAARGLRDGAPLPRYSVVSSTKFGAEVPKNVCSYDVSNIAKGIEDEKII
jgi:hypothetical protein